MDQRSTAAALNLATQPQQRRVLPLDLTLNTAPIQRWPERWFRRPDDAFTQVVSRSR